MKLLITISLFLLLVPNISISQKDTTNRYPIFYNPEFYPNYPGGEEKLMQFIRENLSYPESEKLYGIYGIVYVQFTVEKDGSTSDFEIKRSPHELLSKEALRICNLLPNKWEPGGYYTPKGKIYKKCRMTLPFKFENQNNLPIDGDFYTPTMPSFPGGDSALFSFLNENLKSLIERNSKNEKQKVYVQFTVEKNGDLSNITIIRSPNELLSIETLRVMKLMPKWNPAIEKKQKVSMRMVLPINFY